MSKLKIAIVGCGFIANRKHMPSLSRQADRVELVAFCDLVRERAEKAAQEYGVPGARVCVDYQEIVNDPAIDVVHVCTPNSSHAEISVAALDAGKHVMCEKPMAINTAEARSMLEAQKRSGRLLTIGYQNRYRVDTTALKNLCWGNELGDIYFAKAHAVRRRGIPNWGVFTNKQLQGGGALIDIGTHALDITLWMMNNYKPVSVFGSTFNKLGTTLRPGEQGGNMVWDPEHFEVEDSAFALVKMENGATIYLEAAWALNTTDVREAMTTLCGTKAGATMTSSGNSNSSHLQLNSVLANRQAEIKVDTVPPPAVAFAHSSQATPEDVECNTWLDAVEGKGELVVLPEQALVVTGILEAVYQSAGTGKLVPLSF